MLTTTYEMLQNAYKGRYTVPAINTQGRTYDTIQTMRMATEKLRSPVILVHYTNTGTYSGHDWFYETAKWMAARISVSAATHLDHGDSSERCMEMLKLGFTSIMFDGFALLVEENAAATEVVARVCRSFGVSLETKVGELRRLDDKGNEVDVSNIAGLDMVRQYLKLCHPDSLVIGVGNAHEFYNGPVDIQAEVLEECRKLTDILFVLYGCTGMDEELVKHSIDNGVTKINFGTQVRRQYTNYLKEGLAEGKDRDHTQGLSQYAEPRLHKDIKDAVRLTSSQEKA